MALENESEFQRFQECHPVRIFLHTNPHKRYAVLSDLLSEAQLLKSKFYREFMAPRHERFSMVLALWHRGSMRGLIGLHRTRNDRDFSPAELRTLEPLHSHFSAALDSVWEWQRERSARHALEAAVAPLPLPLALLDQELKILYHNAAANKSAARWMRPGATGRSLKPPIEFELPSQLHALARRLQATWKGSDERARRCSRSSVVTVAHPSLPGLQASIRLMHLDQSMLAMPFFVVIFENTHTDGVSVPDSLRCSQLARLSVREREVASLVGVGASNKEVATRLGKSALTVKTQLQSIYGKLGVVGRGRLISLLQEY